MPIAVFFLCVLLSASPIMAAADDLPEASGYLAQLELQTSEELYSALLRAEMLFLEGRFLDQLPPATLVVHGPQVGVFFKRQYQQNKAVVDLAARLSAFGVVNISVCETRMGVMGRDRQELFPFVGTVPFGPAEEKRLVADEGFLYF